MNITQKQALTIQNLSRKSSALTSNGGRFSNVLLFSGGENVIIEGENTPKQCITSVLIKRGSGYKEITKELCDALIKEYRL